ncbi:uncharacterized protein LOC126249292 [Schistocerca nitens]|uniref:uncharacterized protein LOC126249292 n=1 Tax=Schistocerca nitens TaxID=7011 RepID=UPI0021173226|nr:uncharacterized protein LOC126249292 [Schistocerca nitens]
MLSMGICRVLSSSWAAQIHVVPKKKKKKKKKKNVWCPFGNYQQLDARTIPDCLGLLSVAIEDIQRTAVTTPLVFCYVYIDDILVMEEKHLHRLAPIFDHLCTQGLVMDPSKCTFRAREVQFLGYTLDVHGIHLLQDNVETINKYCHPITI